MHYLVTGSAGFIGTHLTAALRDNGDTVTSWDTRTGGNCHSPYFGDALDIVQPDAVIHLAAKVGRLFGEDDVQLTIADNAGMTANVAKACGDRGIRLVYASTSEVYGDRGEALCHEGGELHLPHNIYGLSKRWGEEACRLYAPRDLTIWRISMPYGPGLPAGRGRAAIINMLHQALHRKPIPVHRGAERSWCWIGDTVAGMLLTLDQDGGVWNIGRDDNPTPMLDVAEIACDLAGAPYSLIEEVDAPARQTVVKRLGTSKLMSLGWQPTVDLFEGMERTLEWVKTLDAAGNPTVSTTV